MYDLYIIHFSDFTPITQAKIYKGEQLLKMLLDLIRDQWSPSKATSCWYQVLKHIRNGRQIMSKAGVKYHHPDGEE